MASPISALSFASKRVNHASYESNAPGLAKRVGKSPSIRKPNMSCCNRHGHDKKQLPFRTCMLSEQASKERCLRLWPKQTFAGHAIAVLRKPTCSIWPQLLDLYYKPEVDVPQRDIKDRLLFRQVIEALRCLEGGVLRSVQDGNIGSIMGIGAPVWTGGFIQFVNTYGLQRFIDRCDELATTYGERFKAPAIVGEKLAAGAQFD